MSGAEQDGTEKRAEEGEGDPSHLIKRQYYIVDFEKGPQMVRGEWLSADLKVCSWPPWAKTLSQLDYDKRLRVATTPEEDWVDCDVVRIRLKGGECMFFLLLFFENYVCD